VVGVEAGVDVNQCKEHFFPKIATRDYIWVRSWGKRSWWRERRGVFVEERSVAAFVGASSKILEIAVVDIENVVEMVQNRDNGDILSARLKNVNWGHTFVQCVKIIYEWIIDLDAFHVIIVVSFLSSMPSAM
jgi:hypothetical protein